ncbi:MAG TPA: hypothetical protein VM534_06125, partial [Thermoanaerobaculia bacterium]|nr:hypothetical protein [Thermoanaerobaculia bacterium]
MRKVKGVGFASLISLFILSLTGCLAAPGTHPPARRVIDPRTPGDANVAPFSGAVEIGSTLYLSGHLGLDANRRVPES